MISPLNLQQAESVEVRCPPRPDSDVSTVTKKWALPVVKAVRWRGLLRWLTSKGNDFVKRSLWFQMLINESICEMLFREDLYFTSLF